MQKCFPFSANWHYVKSNRALFAKNYVACLILQHVLFSLILTFKKQKLHIKAVSLQSESKNMIHAGIVWSLCNSCIMECVLAEQQVATVSEG